MKNNFIHKTKHYLRAAAVLPLPIQQILSQQELTLQRNIFDSKLHTKKLHGITHDAVFSFRITKAYRGIFRIHRGITLQFCDRPQKRYL